MAGHGDLVVRSVMVAMVWVDVLWATWVDMKRLIDGDV